MTARRCPTSSTAPTPLRGCWPTGACDHDANRQVLAERGWKDGIARKAKPGKKLGKRAQARNKAINRTRARVEHVFGQLRHMGGQVVRAVTLARNELAIALKCAVYNARRLVMLDQTGVEPA
jgi:IS5 family transposase